MTNPEVPREADDFYADLDALRCRMASLGRPDESAAAGAERAWRKYLGSNPEFETYLGANADVNPANILVATDVPSVMGGLKSSKFLLPALPDKLPDEDDKLDLSTIVLPASDDGTFFDYYEAVERYADENYDEALFSVRQAIADARARGQQIDTIFIPDVVNDSAREYFRRLTRLAQDTGIRVVLRQHDNDDQPGHVYYRSFTPPEAESVDAYWRANTLRWRPFARRLPEETAEPLALQALRHVVPEPREHDTQASDELAKWMFALSNTNAAVLQSMFGGNGPGHEKINTLKELAFGTEYVNRHSRTGARLILAKIGDPESLEDLKREQREKTGGYGDPGQMMVPFGEYMRQDPALLQETIRRTKAMVAANPGSNDIIYLIGSLYHTNDPQVADFLSGFMEVPEGAGKEYARNVVGSTLRWLGDYIDVLAAKPAGPEGDAAWEALGVIEIRLAKLLEDLLPGGRRQHVVDQTGWIGAIGVVADMLMVFGAPEHQDLLRRAMLHSFRENGSILEAAGTSGNPNFVRSYARYRRLYGDLPEISQLIWTPERRREER